jgi:putative flippase GtrA/GT2 family glycosyltransferase
VTGQDANETVGLAGSHALTAMPCSSSGEDLHLVLSIPTERAGHPLDRIEPSDDRALSVVDGTPAGSGIDTNWLGKSATQLHETAPHDTARPMSGDRLTFADRLSDRRGLRFALFSVIGGVVFLMGLGIQLVLTGWMHVPAVASYLVQGVASVESSFLLNRWLTWRDRDTPFWRAFARFNGQKTITILLNLAMYAELLHLGVNYLLANVVLTALFTVVNYVAGDRFVFIPSPAAEPLRTPVAAPAWTRDKPTPRVTIVIPCRNNENTIAGAVQSVLDQDYPGLDGVIVIGSPGDRTWSGLTEIADPRLVIREVVTPPGLRDANFKRDAAIRMTSGELIALVDSDIVLPTDWLRRAVSELEASGASCVTGGMRSAHDTFWGRYTDRTWIGAKTPRITHSYTVTSADFGVNGRKPPILANSLFTREMYDACPIDGSWSHGSYEDYEWFWRVTKAGYRIYVSGELFGWHHHRRGLRAQAEEYRRSSRGCAYFIRAHRDCPLAKRRLRQVVFLPVAAITGACAAGVAAASGHGMSVLAVLLGSLGALALHQVARSRSAESLAYLVTGFSLGLVFTAGLAVSLIQLEPVP